MNFNELANTVINSVNPLLTEETESRKPNPDFQSWKSSQSPEFIAGLKNPYTHWYLKVKGKTPAADTPVAPETEVTPTADDITSEPVDNGSTDLEGIKTKAAIEDFLTTNPEASVSDIVDHLKGLNNQGFGLKTSYITHAPEIEEMLADIKNQIKSDAAPASVDPIAADIPEPELTAIDRERKAKFDKLRKFIKMKKADRDKYLAARSQSHLDKDVDGPDEDEEEEEDSIVKSDPLARKLVDLHKDQEDEPEFGGQDD